MRRREELLHVDVEHVEAVSAGVETLAARNLEPRELRGPIDRAVVVGAHHVGGHRLAEVARAAHADVLLLRIEYGIEIPQHPAFVYIHLRVPRLTQHGCPRVEIDAHAFLPSLP